MALYSSRLPILKKNARRYLKRDLLFFWRQIKIQETLPMPIGKTILENRLLLLPVPKWVVLKCTVFCESAAATSHGEITRGFRDFLEKIIREEPHNYLWTHRRWKWDYKEEYSKNWIDTRPVQ